MNQLDENVIFKTTQKDTVTLWNVPFLTSMRGGWRKNIKGLHISE